MYVCLYTNFCIMPIYVYSVLDSDLCLQAPPRNHPLLLLSGVATNAIGYDLAPGVSFFLLLH